MKFTINIFLAVLVLFPSVIFSAGPEVFWDDSPAVSGESIIGYLNITGITSATPPLVLVLFADSGDDFNPYVSHALIGPADNGPVTFQTPYDTSLTHFLPVLVDGNSYNGAFSPYEDGGQFVFYSIGQVGQINGTSGGGSSGGGGTSGGGGNGTGGGGTSGGGTTGTGNGNGTGTGGGGAGAGSTDNTASTLGWPSQVIDNPLQVSDLNNFIVGLLNALIKIGIPIMTVFLVYSGLRLVMARGNEKELVDAKKNLLWVIIGAAILLGGWTIVKVLKGTFDEIDLVYITSLINHIV